MSILWQKPRKAPTSHFWGSKISVRFWGSPKSQNFFFQNTSFPYSKSYSNVRKHISDTPRHSRHVQNTILILKTYFGNENYDFSLLKLQRKNDHFVESSLYRYPSVFYRGSCEKIEKRSNKFFSKIRRFLTPNRILMFENTSPTLLDTRDVFRIRF